MEKLKETIFASSGLGRLQMVSELDSEDARPRGGWIVRSHISWRVERNIPYKGVETSPQQTRLKILVEPQKKKPKEVGLRGYV